MLAILSSLGLLHSGGRSRNVLVPPLKIAMMGGEGEGETYYHFQFTLSRGAGLVKLKYSWIDGRWWEDN